MNRIVVLKMMQINQQAPPNPKDGAFIQIKHVKFVTLYNAVLDTYGIFKTDSDWSHYYWSPPEEYIYPQIQWEKLWKEMDLCTFGYPRNYLFSETANGPEIHFNEARL